MQRSLLGDPPSNPEPPKRREPRRRCKVCGGPLYHADNYPKTDHNMITYRDCGSCGRRFAYGEYLIGEVKKGKTEKNPKDF